MTEKRKTAARSSGRTEFASQRRVYRQEREGALRELDAKLDELKKAMLEATSEMRQDLDASMKALGEKRRKFVARMADLRESSGDAWKDLRKGVDNSWDELEDSFGDLRKGVSSAIGRFKEGADS